MKQRGTDTLKDIRSSRGHQLDGKSIVMGISGSIAAIEAPALARELIRRGAEVHAVTSGAAERLVKTDALEWATGNPVIRALTGKTEHVRLVGSGKGRADLMLIAPCTANTVSKIALGIDDTPVTTFASMALGGGIPLVVCPAAHEPMYGNPAVSANLVKLRERGVEVVEPRMEEGKAKMAEARSIVEAVVRRLSAQDLSGRRVLVTGGPTVEFIDPVRVITNLSSGKMGLSLAMGAWRRGAAVSYVYGGTLSPPPAIGSRSILTTGEMLDAIVEQLGKEEFDVFIAAAAPADFTPAVKREDKIPTRNGGLHLELRPTPKIVDEVKKRFPSMYTVAFKAETVGSKKELLRRARRFMERSGIEMVVANSVSERTAFRSDYNEVLIVTKDRTGLVPIDTKENVAQRVLDEISRDLRKESVSPSRRRS